MIICIIYNICFYTQYKIDKIYFKVNISICLYLYVIYIITYLINHIKCNKRYKYNNILYFTYLYII